MKRRAFIAIAGAAATWPLLARGQSQRRLVLAHSAIAANSLTEAAGPFWVRRLHEELRRLGYAEGVNLVIERFSAEGRSDRFTVVAESIVASKPDVIVCNLNGLVKAIMSATATIPIVAIMSNPLAAGLVASLGMPGGNLTGVSVDAGPGMASKRLQVLNEALPAATRFAYIEQKGESPRVFARSVEIKSLTQVDEPTLRKTFGEIAEQRFDAAIVSEGGSFLAHRKLIVELAATHHLPVVYPFRDYWEVGGLFAYAPELGELANRMALDVRDILNGVNPAGIPIFQPTKFELLVNLKTARALRLSIPQLLLAQADDVSD